MVRALLSLYVRAGTGVAQLALRVAVRGADLAVDAVRTVIPSSGQPGPTPSEDVSEPPAKPRPEPPPEPPAEPPRDLDYEHAASQPLDEASERAKTIDDEPELVAEFAEPGAEDGASAELEVDEPWEGYDALTADEAIARIGQADTAALAVVELYERSHKQRRTVLTAVERRKRELANAPS